MMIAQFEAELLQGIRHWCGATLGDRTRQRLAYFVAGILLAETLVLRQIASRRAAVQVDSPDAASHDRRLRRIRADAQLTWETAYAPAARQVLHLQRAKRLRIIIDETSQREHFRVLTAAVWYRNRAIPLAWVQWPAQQPIPRSYWDYCRELLGMVARLVPPAVQVIVLADRAFGHPTFTDQVAALGWDWVVRLQQQTCFTDVQGCCMALRDQLPARGGRWKGRGRLFKKAGWREASVVAYWSRRHKEPLLLASSLPVSWDLIAEYRRRGAIETLFRDWKSAGWQWEASQVRSVERHARLLLGLAWATLVAVVLGEEVVQEVLARPGQGWRSRTWAGKHSLFRLGRDRLAGRLAGRVAEPIRWELAAFDAPGWQAECRQHHAPAGVIVRPASPPMLAAP
jgi:hypothetical protein